MKIIIIGAGEVGSYLAEILSKKGEIVTVIENDYERINSLKDQQEATYIQGDGQSCQLLFEYGIHECDYFMAMTSNDQTNILSASLAKAMGAKQTIARIHDKTYLDHSYINFQSHFGIDLLLNPEALCAVELVKNLRNPYSVAVENLARGKIQVQQVEVARRSKAGGKPLKDLKIDPRVRVGYIQSGDNTIVASADRVVHAGDKVAIFGEQEAINTVRQLFSPEESKEKKKVVLLGGTEITLAIIRLLKNPKFRITVIEHNRDHCIKIAEQFPHVRVINDDETSLRVLEEVNLNDCDFFVSCSKKDENNILSCVQAHKLGAKNVQVAINKSDYEDVLESLKEPMGVNTIVSPRVATANEVIQTISNESYTVIGDILDGVAKIVEIRIPHKVDVIGKKIKEIEKPRDSIFVALMHKFNAKVPAADDIILGGDTLIVIAKHEDIRVITKVLGYSESL